MEDEFLRRGANERGGGELRGNEQEEEERLDEGKGMYLDVVLVDVESLLGLRGGGRSVRRGRKEGREGRKVELSFLLLSTRSESLLAMSVEAGDGWSHGSLSRVT